MHNRKLRLVALLAAVAAAFAVFAGTAQAYPAYGYANHNNGTPFVGTVFIWNHTTQAGGSTGSDPITGWFNFKGLVAGYFYTVWICTREGVLHNFDAELFTQPPWGQEHDLKATESEQGCW